MPFKYHSSVAYRRNRTVLDETFCFEGNYECRYDNQPENIKQPDCYLVRTCFTGTHRPVLEELKTIIFLGGKAEILMLSAI